MTAKKDIRQRCFEARCAASWWATECKEMKTEKEIIEEANKRYNSFFERTHFIRSAEETFCLIQYRKKKQELRQQKEHVSLD